MNNFPTLENVVYLWKSKSRLRTAKITSEKRSQITTISAESFNNLPLLDDHTLCYLHKRFEREKTPVTKFYLSRDTCSVEVAITSGQKVITKLLLPTVGWQRRK